MCTTEGYGTVTLYTTVRIREIKREGRVALEQVGLEVSKKTGDTRKNIVFIDFANIIM